MNVHHMQLINQTDAITLVISLVVGVLIDHTDDLLRRHILGVRLARDIERRGLRRLSPLDREILLIVGNGSFGAKDG